LDQAWDRGYTGKGVAVTILDDGVQADHPDLQANFASFYLNIITYFYIYFVYVLQDFASSTDLNSFDNDPTPQANRKNAYVYITYLFCM
jgi:subtilisin family serine protease